MGIISTGPGSPLSFSSASGGKFHAYNALTIAPQLVIGPNTNRQRLTFHNPSAIDVFVFPSVVIDFFSGSNTPLVASVSSPGGAFLIYANGGALTIEGECSGAWNAFARSGATAALTVMDSNI